MVFFMQFNINGNVSRALFGNSLTILTLEVNNFLLLCVKRCFTSNINIARLFPKRALETFPLNYSTRSVNVREKIVQVVALPT